jgi:hypothetical protein
MGVGSWLMGDRNIDFTMKGLKGWGGRPQFWVFSFGFWVNGIIG